MLGILDVSETFMTNTIFIPTKSRSKGGAGRVDCNTIYSAGFSKFARNLLSGSSGKTFTKASLVNSVCVAGVGAKFADLNITENIIPKVISAFKAKFPSTPPAKVPFAIPQLTKLFKRNQPPNFVPGSIKSSVIALCYVPTERLLDVH
jgi:hypothetical protein